MEKLMNEKIIPRIMAFINMKGIQAIKDGMVYSMPLLIVGSVFLIITNFPIQAVVDVLEQTGIKAVLEQANGATFNISAMIAVLGISYNYIKLEGQEPLSGAIVALGVFIMMTPASIVTESGDVVGGIINKGWTAGQGMVGAIIVGLIVGFVYCWFLKRNIRIKMPAGVPDGVSNAFSALIPGAVIVLGATIVHGIFSMGFHTTAMEAIYNVIQTPLQSMTDSIGGAVLMCFLTPFLWFFGVHGSTIVGGIMTGILQANSLENQALVEQGIELTVKNGGHIVTMQFFDQFINTTGAGITIGLVIYMFALAKSKQLKTLGRIFIGPSIFNINEPIMFGAPVVFNPLLMLPMWLNSIVGPAIVYIVMSLGWLNIPATLNQVGQVPVPVSTVMITQDMRGILWAVVLFVVYFAIWYPFFKVFEKQKLAEEAQENAPSQN